MSSDCGASGQERTCRSTRCVGLWIAAGALIVGVLVPVGIQAWRQVAAGCVRAAAANRHEARADALFRKDDFLGAAHSLGLARAVADEPRLLVKESRARLAHLADHIEAIDPKNASLVRADCEWMRADDPDYDPVYSTVLGHIASLEGDVDRAFELYRSASERQPSRIGARLGLGLLARKKGDNTTARESLNAVLVLRPDLWQALVALAEIEASAGDNGRAIDLYLKAAAIRDDARLRMGLGLVQAARKDPEAAVASLRKATELDPKLAEAWISLGNLYLSANALPLAEQALRGALQARQDPVVAGTLAAVLNRLNRPSEALQVLTPLLRQQAGPAALIEAARSLESLGRAEEAWAVYQAAAEVLQKIGDAVDPASVAALVREIEAARQRIGPAAPRPAGK